MLGIDKASAAEKGMYTPASDILNVVPEVLIKGAVFALDPNSVIKMSDSAKQDVRATLKYILTLLLQPQVSDMSDMLDRAALNEEAYRSIMQGVGMCLLSEFNKHYKERRLRNVKTGNIIEPVSAKDIELMLSNFEEFKTKVLGE